MAQRVKNPPEMKETQVPSLGREDPLEKAMATHSSVLAWRIPWTKEPAGLQSMEWQRVGHELSDETTTTTATGCFMSRATGEASLMAQMVKNSPAKTGDGRDIGSIPGSGRSSEGGNGNPLQYSCLEISMDRGI